MKQKALPVTYCLGQQLKWIPSSGLLFNIPIDSKQQRVEHTSIAFSDIQIVVIRASCNLQSFLEREKLSMCFSQEKERKHTQTPSPGITFFSQSFPKTCWVGDSLNWFGIASHPKVKMTSATFGIPFQFFSELSLQKGNARLHISRKGTHSF